MAKIIITEFLNGQRTFKKNAFLQRCTNGQQFCEKKLTMTNHQGNANQNQIRYCITSHLLGWPLLKTKQNHTCWPGCGAKETPGDYWWEC